MAKNRHRPRAGYLGYHASEVRLTGRGSLRGCAVSARPIAPFLEVGRLAPFRPSDRYNRNYVGLPCTFHDPVLAVDIHKGRVSFVAGAKRHFQFKSRFHCRRTASRILATSKKLLQPDTNMVLSRTWNTRHHRLMRLAAWINPHFVWFSLVRPQHVSREGPGDEHLRCRHQTRCHTKYTAPRRRLVERDCDHHRCHPEAACYSNPIAESVYAVVDGYRE